MEGFGVKLPNASSGGSVNVTELGERLADLANKHNITQIKSNGHRFNSSRLFDRLSSKPMPPMNTAVRSFSNKSMSSEQKSVNVTLLSVKNVTNGTDQANQTTGKREERSIADQLSLATEEASSMIQNIPKVLSEAGSNVTSWAMGLFNRGNDTSVSDGNAKRVVREANSTKFGKLLVNSTQPSSNKTSNQTLERLAVGVLLDTSNSSMLNLSAVTIKREVVNKTLNDSVMGDKLSLPTRKTLATKGNNPSTFNLISEQCHNSVLFLKIFSGECYT